MLDIVKGIDEDKSSQLGQGREEVMGGWASYCWKRRETLRIFIKAQSQTLKISTNHLFWVDCPMASNLLFI